MQAIATGWDGVIAIPKSIIIETDRQGRFACSPRW